MVDKKELKKRRKKMKKFESIIISCTPIICAFIGQKYLFNLFDFKYDMFNDSFDIAKLMIDFGVYIALF